MEIVGRYLSDVLLIRPDITNDPNESLFSYSSRDLQAAGITAQFVQDNQSRSAVNVLRGLHYQTQHPQGKFICVLSGRIFDVAVDLRRNSQSFGLHAAFQLSAKDRLLLWIPPGYAHGFLVMEGPADVAYSVTDYRYAEFERTLLWSDPALGIDWPVGAHQPTLSEKDKQGTLFANCDYYG